jgi:hypothetical protein
MRSVVLAAVIVLGLAAAGPASATYPGRDGRIAFFATVSCPRYTEAGDPCNALAFSAVMTVSPFGHHDVTRVPCTSDMCVVGAPRGPVYSLDGRLMAVRTASATSPAQVAILRADGSEIARVDVPTAGLAGLEWLPDGRIVAYGHPERPGAAGRAFVIGLDRVAREVAWRPKGLRTWSSKGDVAIAHARGIYVWDHATGVRRLVLPNGGRFTYWYPDWSPNGRRLVVVRDDLRTGLQAILTTAAGGGDRRVVARSVGTGCAFGDVVWSPSGRRIAYSAGCYESGAIYTVRTDGARLRRIFDAESLSHGGALETYIGPEISWQRLGL